MSASLVGSAVCCVSALEHRSDAIVERFGDLRGYLYFCSLGASLLAKGLVHAAPPDAALALVD